LIHKQKKQGTKFSTKHSNKKLTARLEMSEYNTRPRLPVIYCALTKVTYFRCGSYKLVTKLSLLLSTVLN